ncbi:MAG: hypothetical protein CFE35_09790 [Novosphingobium sp. PASSN1]|nr:MAG: hypothetical protein CFE35_09790 [Novosphingobium sp. PASSN1]
MFGGKGNDIYIADNLLDSAVDVASSGNDEVRASVDFKLSSNIEKLTLTGEQPIDGTGNALDNVLIGNDKPNELKGERGNDVLDGGKGNDVLSGGEGADKFVFAAAPSSVLNFDVITDFSSAAHDRIVLALDVFADFGGAGKIGPDAFKAGPGVVKAAADGQFLIYDTTTGALYYDAEGPDGGNPVKIAQLGLSDHPVLAWSDFVIIG